jgi:hypothetical protein
MASCSRRTWTSLRLDHIPPPRRRRLGSHQARWITHISSIAVRRCPPLTPALAIRVKEQYEQIIAAGGRIAGPAAEALIANRLDDAAVDWLKTNFLKTELELGHCLRLPQEGPCECDLYLRCSKFFTTSQYAPRLRARLACEQQLIDDAVERGWPREVERHTAISRRLCELLADLGEPTGPPPLEPSSAG